MFSCVIRGAQRETVVKCTPVLVGVQKSFKYLKRCLSQKVRLHQCLFLTFTWRRFPGLHAWTQTRCFTFTPNSLWHGASSTCFLLLPGEQIFQLVGFPESLCWFYMSWFYRVTCKPEIFLLFCCSGLLRLLSVEVDTQSLLFQWQRN